MKTTLERDEKQVPPFGRNDRHRASGDGELVVHDKVGSRARVSATIGAAVWAGLSVLARAGMVHLGAIELLFLFAPLVVVPLGMELGRVLGESGRLAEIARRMHPAGAALAVLALLLPVGKMAAVAAGGWLAVCVLMAGDGVAKLIWSPWKEADRSVRSTWVVLAIARIDLAVGGAWLAASRMGMRPMGIQEPIGLLTAVHFHYAGFATATIAAATVGFAEGRTRQRIPTPSTRFACSGQALPQKTRETWGNLRVGPWLRRIVMMVAALPYVVAAGFVISAALKMTAAILFSASVVVLAIFLRACGREAADGTARVLLQTAAGAVLVGMMLAGAYALADFLGRDALTIPQMARTHGIVNAAFCLAGILGWLVERAGKSVAR